jgi:hypothetical protein
MKTLGGMMLCAAIFGVATSAMALDEERGRSERLRQAILFGDGSQGFGPEAELRTVLNSEDAEHTFSAVEAPVAKLQNFFSDRARRQQRFMDGGSLITVIGVTGAFASGGAGAVTQGYWGAAGFAPILASNFNAYEPTRELHEIGSRGIDLIRARYRGMHRSAAAAKVSWTNAGDGAAVKAACDSLAVRLGKLTDQAHSPYRQSLEPELERLIKLCDQTRDTRARLSWAKSVLPGENDLPYAYGFDVLALREDLKQRDRSVRYTPLQTLSSMLAAPFLAVGATLSGSNGAASIASVSEAAALREFQVPLWSSPSPALPAALDEGVSVSPVTEAVVVGGDRSSDAAVKAMVAPLDLKATLKELSAATAAIRGEALALNKVRADLELYRSFEALDTLTASADPATRQGQVRLQPKGATEIPTLPSAASPTTTSP